MIHAGMQETVDLGAKVAEEPLVLPWLDKADLDADGRINAKPHHLANKPSEPGKVLANDLAAFEGAKGSRGHREEPGVAQSRPGRRQRREAVRARVICLCLQYSGSAWQCLGPGWREVLARARFPCRALPHCTGLPSRYDFGKD